MNETRKAKANQTSRLSGAAVLSVSTRNFMPYWVVTEQATATNTAVRMTLWAIGRSLT